MGTMTRQHGGVPSRPTETRTDRGSVAGAQAEGTGCCPGQAARERIEARAYEIFQRRQRQGGVGDATSDWLQAERELNGTATDPVSAAAIELKARARGEALLADSE